MTPRAAAAATAPAGLEFTDARPIGGTHVLDAVWRRLGIDTALRAQTTGRRLGERAERIAFALVANRALAPSSKLAATGWIAHQVHIDGLGEVVDEACYRTMDWLLDIEAVLAEEVFHATANLLNLEVDLLFSTRPPPTSRSRTPTSRSVATPTAGAWTPTTRLSHRRGCAASARPRTTATTCRR